MSSPQTTPPPVVAAAALIALTFAPDGDGGVQGIAWVQAGLEVGEGL